MRREFKLEFEMQYETVDGVLWRVYTYKNMVYRIKDSAIDEIKPIFGFPPVIQESILLSAKMRHNPD